MQSPRPLILVLLAACATAQTPPPQTTAELSSHEEPATFKARVNLVSVPVVVRDAQGHAIGNLNKDDFQLFDKGKLQIITRFSVERRDHMPPPQPVQADGQPPAEPPPSQAGIPEHYVAYLFDDVHLE